jgi:multicomponent Na+:H+ antiporter subunit G
MSALLDLFTTVALLLGALFFLAGVVGLLRFPDTLSRLHALTKADNVGLGLIVIGLLPQAGSVFAALKLLLVWLLVLLAASTVGQLMARVARRAGPPCSRCWCSAPRCGRSRREAHSPRPWVSSATACCSR